MITIIRKKKLEYLKKEKDRLEATKEIAEKELDLANEEYRRLQLQVWNLEQQLQQAEQNNKLLERSIKTELWQKVHEILTTRELRRRDREQYGITNMHQTKEICGCYCNPFTKKWEVIVGGSIYDDEEPERVLFCYEEDALCYHELHTLFGMRPEVKTAMQGYLIELKKSA